MNDLFGFLGNLPVLNSRKNAVTACLLGLFFGSIGIGIYFGSMTDFLIPVLVLIVLAVIIPGLGALPGWIFAGLYGYFRAINSNTRRDS
jgi:hypothetical protein